MTVMSIDEVSILLTMETPERKFNVLCAPMSVPLDLIVTGHVEGVP